MKTLIALFLLLAAGCASTQTKTCEEKEQERRFLLEQRSLRWDR